MGKIKVDNAIIVVSKRQEEVVPLTFEKDKEFLEIKGESLLERQIKQLLNVGITDITVAVDEDRDELNYLKDEYGIKISHELKYANENNFLNLYYCRHLLSNTYLLSGDNYMVDNIFNEYEERSWIAGSNKEDNSNKIGIEFDEDDRITSLKKKKNADWQMYGPIFLTEADSKIYRRIMEEYYQTKNVKNYNIEDVLIGNIEEFNIYLYKQTKEKVYELDNLDELRDLDEKYKDDSSNEILEYIASVFNIKQSEIKNSQPLEVGMTNSSFTFEVGDNKYICRVPGEGTDELVNRLYEHDVYLAIKELDISDRIIAFDRETGIKLTKFFSDSRSMKLENPLEVAKSIDILKTLHKSGAKVSHEFDIKNKIREYIDLCSEDLYESELFSQIRFKMRELIGIEEAFDDEDVLVHADANKNNYLVDDKGNIILIDWEYAGMGPALLDIGMFCIYGDMPDEEVYKITQYYLGRDPEKEDLLKVYVYMGLGSFLWAIWTEYKSEVGVDYFDYKLRMYNHANSAYDRVKEIQSSGINNWIYSKFSR